MVGNKVRQLRLALGLSQQQLAGREMTRAFVSLVETNKCMPSPETLRVIAQRLGKPVEYFVEASNAEDELADIVIPMLESAERELAQGSGDMARRKLNQALKRLVGFDRTDLEAHARSLLLQCLRKLNLNEEVLEEGERSLECYTRLNDVRGLAQTHQQIGTAAFLLEDFARARRAYEKAALYSSGLKQLQGFRADVLSFLGSTLHRLGAYPESIACYQEALAESAPLNTREQWGSIAMGLGWVYFRQGCLPEAVHWTNRALEVLRHAGSPNAVLARHNLAIMEAARGNWETAYAGFQACLKVYRERGFVEQHASVLEDLAHYWMHRRDLDRVEQMCWDALDLLDIQDNGIVRGRLYRLLGRVAVIRGHLSEARSMLQVSHELFRRLKSTVEADTTLQELQQVRQSLAATAAPDPKP